MRPTVKLVERSSYKSLEPTVYQVTTEHGNVLEVRKEFYAAGPSLFTWVVYSSDGWEREFRTKRAAVRYVEENW